MEIMSQERINDIEGAIKALDIVRGFFDKLLSEDIIALTDQITENQEELLEGNIENLETLVQGLDVEIRAAKQIL